MTLSLRPFRGVIAALGLVALAGCDASDSGPSIAPPAVPVSGLDVRPDNATCVAPERPAPAFVTAELIRVFPALTFDQPVLAAQVPGDSSRWFVVEQAGRVRAFDNPATGGASSVFLDISARVSAGDETGLLGLAFDPDFAVNGRVFVHYTRMTGSLQSVLAVFRSQDGGVTLDPDSEQILLTVTQPFANHNGGHLAFGRDGMLYLSLGDGGGAGDPFNNAQNTHNLLGKILRLDVRSGADYTVPATNRFAGNPRCANGAGALSCPEIFAFGFRNAWRFSFDSATGNLWAGDVGQGESEEINRVLNGGNYGWRLREGQSCYDSTSGCPTVNGGDSLIEPQVAYGRDVGGSVTGGYVYRGRTAPGLTGRYLFGDFVSGRIMHYTPETWAPPQELLDSALSISSFAEDQDGEIYVVDYNGGLYRIEASSTGGSSTVPDLLSETGCVDPDNPASPASALIAFRINSPLWSDNASKERWIALPNGQSISVSADGDWQFPAGTVLIKNFSLGSQLVETRLLMHHPDGVWAGYSYEWSDDGRDATRVIGGKRRSLGAQDWIYPSESECLRCHTHAAGRSLGPETAQLNGDFHYPLTGRTANQLATLDAIGVLRPPFGTPPASLPAYPDFTGASGSTAERARALLHANCSGCHRPGGPTGSPIDLRYDIALDETNACDEPPTRGDLGIPDARLIAPGDPDRSVLLARDSRRDSAAMPPLGSLLINEAGIALLRDWIEGLTSCQ